MKKRAKAVDAYVGSRMRVRRSLLGVSQEQLGQALGVSFQQVQKYERGTNRVSASRLYRLAKFLDVPVSFFFDGISETAVEGSFALQEAPVERYETEPYVRRETLELVRAYYKIRNSDVRHQIRRLCSTLGGKRGQEKDGGEGE